MQGLTLKDLVLIAALFVTIVGGIFLIRLLKNAGALLLSLKRILDNNNDNINSIMKDLPKITEKTAEITSDTQLIVSAFKEEQKAIDRVLQDVSETVGSVSATIQALNDDVFTRIKGLFNALIMLIKMITKMGRTKDSDLTDDGDLSDERGSKASFSKKEARIKKRKRKKVRTQPVEEK